MKLKIIFLVIKTNFPLQMILVISLIPTSDNCSEAYNQFLVHYKKTYNQEKESLFCENYKGFLEIRQTCPQCIVTSIYDRDFNQMLGYNQMHQINTQDNKTCQQVICNTKDPLPPLKKIPESVDQRMSGLITRAKDQEDCGSCWAFATTAVLENTILLDQYQIKQNQFARNARTLSLSEQFLMSNTYGQSKYCNAGRAEQALNYQIDNEFWNTLELESNYHQTYYIR